MSTFGVATTLLVFLFRHDGGADGDDAVSLGDVFVDHVEDHLPVVGKTLEIVEDLLLCRACRG